ncbi:MAG: thioesterase family protein [Gammaproteobacteria bacterium]|nr:thioesterase family protein [Gammaproteobacteria bacterium]
MKFSEVLATLRPQGDEWAAHIPIDWAQGRTVFGGLQAALLVRAMRAVLGNRRGLPLRSLHVTFVGPVAAGREIRLRPEHLRTGRSASHARCDLLTPEGVACCGVAIFGAPRPSQVAIEIPKIEVGVDPDSLTDLPHVPGVIPDFVQQFQLRWALGTRQYTGYHEPKSIIFARLRDLDCSGEDALIALADSIPSPALSMLERPAPANSLNWMLELLGDPERLDRSAWSTIGTEVRAGCDGYLSQTSILWGPGGHAFSVSHQSVGVFG